MKYALIGCGRIAINHLKAALDNNLEIVALCDIDINKIDLLIEKSSFDYNVDKYDDYKKMLKEHPDIDLVSIATDSDKHAKIALYCIERKINVIVEKPMALSLSDADKIISLSKKNKVKVTVCHQNRFNEAVIKTKKALDNNKLGKISHASLCVRWNRNEDYYKQASWRGKYDSDGGCLFNQCIHGIDLLCWLMNSDIKEVYGTIKNQQHPYIEVEDLGMAIIKFTNGAIASLEGTVNVYPKNLEETIYLFGENGTIKLGGVSVNNVDIFNIKDGDKEDKLFKEDVNNIYGNGHISLYKNMIEAIKYDKEPLINIDDARKDIELILAIYESSKDNKSVIFPLKEGSSKEYKGTFSGI